MLNITLTITAAPELLAELSSFTNSITSAKVVTVPQAPVQTSAVQTSAVPASSQTYTMEQLAVAATQLVDAGLRSELVSLLQTFGVQALTALPKEQYGAFATQLRTIGAKIDNLCVQKSNTGDEMIDYHFAPQGNTKGVKI